MREYSNLAPQSADELFALLQVGKVIWVDCSDGFLAIFKRGSGYALVVGQPHYQLFDCGPEVSKERVISMIHSATFQSSTHDVFFISRNQFFSTMLEMMSDDKDLFHSVSH